MERSSFWWEAELSGAALQQGAREVRGAGDWKTSGRARRAAPNWDLDTQRDGDGFFRGPIRVGDSPLLAGAIEGDTVSGSYTDRTGEVGGWTWEGGAQAI